MHPCSICFYVQLHLSALQQLLWEVALEKEEPALTNLQMINIHRANHCKELYRPLTERDETLTGLDMLFLCRAEPGGA